MQRGVFATLFHSNSTDEIPRHDACPVGEDSWCHYNRHRALVAADKPSVPRSHRPAFSRDVAKELVPLYNRFSKSELLVRCSRMQTQNANESFNALLWKMCPKTDLASLRTVETAEALAVLEFNEGTCGIKRVLDKLELEQGVQTNKHVQEATKQAISRARARAMDSSKVEKKSRCLEAIASEQPRVEEEGPTYAAGHFDLIFSDHKNKCHALKSLH